MENSDLLLQLLKEIQELRVDMPKMISQAIASHADSCAALRWRNLVILVMASGVFGGFAGGLGAIELVKKLFGA